MVIAGIMLGMFIPQFEKMMAGSRINAGAKIIAGQLSLAHQYAQTSGKYVALLMPDDQMTNLTEEYMYSICRLAYVDSNSDFDSWIDGSKWIFLPTSCSIMEADGDTGIKGYDSGTNSKFYSVYPNDDPLYVTITIDRAANGGEPQIGEPLVPDNTYVDGSVLSCRAVIFKPSGRLKQATPSHRYITVGEAEYFAGVPNDWIIVNPGAATEPDKFKSCANQVTLKVNGFTGGVKFLTIDKMSLDPEDEE